MSHFASPLGLVESLRQAQHVAVLTGAGISAESGLQTFRDAQTGLWTKFRPEELATPQAFRRNPKLVWDWYAARREQAEQVRPNPGHLALVDIEQHVPRLTLITQNVDGLHQRAGSKSVLELHGNIHRYKCFQEGIIVASYPDTGEVPPRCPRCGGFLRPDVVWFGEMLPADVLQAAAEAAYKCDVFFSIGTSGLVEPAASLAHLALQHGAVIVEINPTETPLTSLATYPLSRPAGQVLPALVRATWLVF